MPKSLTLLALAGTLACAHSSPGQTAATQTAAPDAGGTTDAGPFEPTPPGCERPLAGEWEHQDDPSYRYSASDDGRVLTLRPHRATDDGKDGGSGPEGMSIELQRGQAGFSGQFKMIEEVEGGKKCPASFGAHVVSCSADKITLRIEQSYAVDKNCLRVDTGGSDVAEHVLVRHADPVPGGDR